MGSIRSNAANPEDEKKEKAEAKKTEEIQTLVNYLVQKTQDLPPSTRPVDELGYYQREKDRKRIIIRENLIDTQRELAQLEKDSKTLNQRMLLQVKESYRKLHEIQAQYVDDLLRGKIQDIKDKDLELKKFKDDQAGGIKVCNEKLDQLLKDNETSTESKEIAASIAKQKKQLEDLPNQIEKTRDELIKGLKNQKQNYKYDCYDKAVNGNRENLENRMFSVYLQRDPKLETEQKTKLDEFEDAIDFVGSSKAAKDEKGRSIPNDKIRKGYKEAQKIVLDEIKRAENDPPHESWFIPFGKESEEVPYLIHRFKKNDQWYIEPEMLRGEKITANKKLTSRTLTDRIKDFFSSTEVSYAYTNYKAMVEKIFDFQKFAHCETDIITLSYPGKVYAQKNLRDRIDQILAVIDLIIKKGEDDPPTKRFELDENGKDVLFRCTDKKRREALETKLRTVNELAKGDLEKIKKDKPEGIDIDTTKLQDDIKATADSSVQIIEDVTERGLYKNITGNDKKQKNTSAKDLNTVLGSVASGVPNKVEEEKEIIEQALDSLDSIQDTLDKHVKEVDRIRENDPDHPDLDKLVTSLKALDDRQKEIVGMLDVRCQDWLRMGDEAKKAEQALERLRGEQAKFRDMKLNLVDAERDASDEEVKRLSESLAAQGITIQNTEKEIGGLDKTRIGMFQDGLGKHINDFRDRLEQNRMTSNNLSTRVNDISNNIASAKTAKDAAYRSFSSP